MGRDETATGRRASLSGSARWARVQARAEAPCVHSTIDRESVRSQSCQKPGQVRDSTRRDRTPVARQAAAEKRPARSRLISSGLQMYRTRNEKCVMQEKWKGQKGISYGLHWKFADLIIQDKRGRGDSAR